MAAESIIVPAELAQEILHRHQRGETLSWAAYAQAHPHLTDALREWFAERPWLDESTQTAERRDDESRSEPAGSAWTRPLPVLPGYTDLVYLASGGQGDIFRACQPHLNRTVVLKLLRFGYHLDPKQQSRFRRGARSVAQLDHPHIVRVYDCADHAGQLFLVMEYLDGGSMAERVLQPLAPPAACALLADLADAVHHAHTAGIVHRDLKPANVLFNSAGVAKLTDFELVKRMDQDASMPTMTGTIMGTAAYMSPEQAAGKTRAVGPASDIWALGVMLYQALTARLPFVGESWIDVLDAIRTRAPAPFAVPVPPGLAAICLRCLERERTARFATAQDVAQALRTFAATGTAPAPPRPVTPLTLPPLRGTPRLTPLAVPVVAPPPVALPWSVSGYSITEAAAPTMPTLDPTPLRLTTFAAQYHGSPCALHFLSGPHLQPAEYRTTLLPVLAKLAVPVLVPVQAVEEFGPGQVCIRSEALTGGTLAQRLLRGVPPLTQSVRWITEMAQGLAQLVNQPAWKECPFIHGWIQPETIALTSDGNARLLLAGLCNQRPGQVVQSAALEVVLEGRSWAGDPAYLPPELLHAGEYGLTTDIYALGMVLLRLVSGQPAWAASTWREFLHTVGVELPASLSAVVDQDLQSVIAKCVHPEPRSRFATLSELVSALTRYQSGTLRPIDRYQSPAGGGWAGYQDVRPQGQPVLAGPAAWHWWLVQRSTEPASFVVQGWRRWSTFGQLQRAVPTTPGWRRAWRTLRDRVGPSSMQWPMVCP
jgi:serine/threonine protein kinase